MNFAPFHPKEKQVAAAEHPQQIHQQIPPGMFASLAQPLGVLVKDVWGKQEFAPHFFGPGKKKDPQVSVQELWAALWDFLLHCPDSVSSKAESST